jgi:hypothetical protein
LYANDLRFLSSLPFGSPHSLIEDIDHLSNLSGSIGSKKSTTFALPCSLPIKWCGEVDIFGIHIPKERNDLTTIHFNRKLAKLDKILQPWKGQHMYSIFVEKSA